MSESERRNKYGVLDVFSDMTGGITKCSASEKMIDRPAKLRAVNITVVIDDFSRLSSDQRRGPKKESAA